MRLQNRHPSILETKQRLSESILWKLQRNFFEQEGIGAWNTGKVPHYATSNPFIANAYGKVVFGFLRDCAANSQMPLDPPLPPLKTPLGDRGINLLLDRTQPVYIMELGSGSGRFSYHFLKQFFESYARSALKEISVKYIMTDFAQKNLDFWQTHPALQPFIEQGLLDFARFDITSDRTLTLVRSGETLDSQTLKNPLVVLANYFFDSIPQDLFHIEDGQLYETLITLNAFSPNPDLTDQKLLETLDITYTNSAIAAEGYYEESLGFNEVLRNYQTHLKSTYLLFPYLGLTGLKNLRELSGDRLLLLSGDKGFNREESLDGRGKPHLAFHQGCFSLMTNYPAIAQYVQNQGGQSLMTTYRHRSIAICGFLFGQPASNYIETRYAYGTAIENSSPDDFFSLKKALEPHFNVLSLQQTLAYLRFSGWDFKLFLGCFENLMEQVETASPELKQEVNLAIQNIWKTYYFIGETEDLAFHLSMVLFKMGYYAEAIGYIDYSIELYGKDPGMFYNKAKCYCELQSLEPALESLEIALTLYPQFEEAQLLKDKIEEYNRQQNLEQKS